LRWTYLALICCLAVSAADSNAENSQSGLTAKYFGSFAGLYVPVRGVEPISERDALSRNSYCVGYSRSDGKVVRFERHLDGKLFFRHDYEYDDAGGVRRSITTNANGEVGSATFDAKGK
jgi:hypothetical protein